MSESPGPSREATGPADRPAGPPAGPQDATRPPLDVDILTLFPEAFESVLESSILGRARRAGLVRVDFTNLRDFASDRHSKVDDRPYGGGPGMVFKPEPVFAAVEATLAKAKAPPDRTRRWILSPQGERLRQATLRGLADKDWIVLLCGHYEGFDERIFEGLASISSGQGEQPFERLSIGDFVLSGGELPAMVVLDGVVRLLPGALGDPDSARHESFEPNEDGTASNEGSLPGLDFPQYTRPPDFRGMTVPEVLLSGNHQEIARWRREQALERTRRLRADLLEPPQGDETN